MYELSTALFFSNNYMTCTYIYIYIIIILYTFLYIAMYLYANTLTVANVILYTENAPVITQQPSSQLFVVEGNDVSFTVGADGVNLIYTWQTIDGNPLPISSMPGKYTLSNGGATLTIRDVSMTDALGEYFVEVRNSGDSVDSDSFFIRLSKPKFCNRLYYYTVHMQPLFTP